ncbi:hypothetical protein [Halovivax gelatinilyticus]|uniref:hypothetical protein n=1 Tax=Halovivax gelatinilyticus TaxID=2961597 RepID=UPI0020CA4625|nr:hypothetical protein [Halovivax gelatinilyticus]
MGYAPASSIESVTSVEPPDVGAVAVAGVYVGVAVTAIVIAVGAAAGLSGAAIATSVTTAFTAGLVAGAIAIRRTRGIAERLGQGWPWLGALYLVPAGFAIATLLVSSTSTIPGHAAVGTAIGAVGTGLVALGATPMARTRYARAAVDDDPIANAPLFSTTQARNWTIVGLVFVAIGGVQFVSADGALGGVGFWVAAMALYSIAMAWWSRAAVRLDHGESRLARYLPDRTRRSVLGGEWRTDGRIDTDGLPTLAVHDAGLVVHSGYHKRFHPWTSIGDVTLSDDELRIERPRWTDIRCHRAVIDDADALYESIEAARREGVNAQ